MEQRDISPHLVRRTILVYHLDLPEIDALGGKHAVHVAVPAHIDVIADEDLLAPAVEDVEAVLVHLLVHRREEDGVGIVRIHVRVVGIDIAAAGSVGIGPEYRREVQFALGDHLDGRCDHAVDAVVVPGHQLHILDPFGEVDVRSIPCTGEIARLSLAILVIIAEVPGIGVGPRGEVVEAHRFIPHEDRIGRGIVIHDGRFIDVDGPRGHIRSARSVNGQPYGEGTDVQVGMGGILLARAGPVAEVPQVLVGPL